MSECLEMGNLDAHGTNTFYYCEHITLNHLMIHENKEFASREGKMRSCRKFADCHVQAADGLQSIIFIVLFWRFCPKNISSLWWIVIKWCAHANKLFTVNKNLYLASTLHEFNIKAQHFVCGAGSFSMHYEKNINDCRQSTAVWDAGRFASQIWRFSRKKLVELMAEAFKKSRYYAAKDIAIA